MPLPIPPVPAPEGLTPPPDPLGQSLALAQHRIHADRLALLEREMVAGMTSWSLVHTDWDPTYLDGRVDGAIRVYLTLLHEVGVETVSSCQGGFARIGRALLWDEFPIESPYGVRVLAWCRRTAHLHIRVGPGHGEERVVRSPHNKEVVGAKVYAKGLALRGFLRGLGIRSELQTGRDHTLVTAVSPQGLTDLEAHTWWETLTANLIARKSK